MQVLRVDFKLLENELCVLTAPAPWAAQAPANAMLFTQLAATAPLLQPLTPGCISITSLSAALLFTTAERASLLLRALHFWALNHSVAGCIVPASKATHARVSRQCVKPPATPH